MNCRETNQTTEENIGFIPGQFEKISIYLNV